MQESGDTISSDLQQKQSTPFVELSIVMPCLNEADTLSSCIEKAQRALLNSAIAGEVIVADNGSSDGSPVIALRLGARVVHVKAPGYGNALMGGIAAAKGKYVIMGDADDSYNFLEIPKFVERLRQGYDLVQGCRLPAGGGTIMPGAMPFLHRWWGNPMFSFMAQRWFNAPIHDVYCGLRGFTRDLYDDLNLRCTGMEFAPEMIVKASLYGKKISEVPITLHQDGRTSHAPHLKTYRDGWRTLRFFLIYSPRWLFYLPGLFLIALGMLGYGLVYSDMDFGGITFDAHTLLFASLSVLCGYQSVLFAIFSKTFAINEGLLPEDPKLARFFQITNLERGLILAVAALCLGVFMLALSVKMWQETGFGAMDYPRTMRLVIPGAFLTVLGVQTILSSFFVSILGMKKVIPRDSSGIGVQRSE
ncbi:MAG: glycosyltransferase family 2 protein [Nitrospirales bacterium]